jgi:putative flippase GtrA
MLRFLRALLAGGAATLVDLGVLALLVSLVGMSPRAANVPALVAGGLVAFVANRHFVFRAAAGSIVRQATLYVLVEAVALGLNGVLYDVVMRALATHGAWYAAVRLVTSHVVFLAWCFPMWRLVFHVRAPRAAV